MQKIVLFLLIGSITYCFAQDIKATDHYFNGLSRYKTKDFKTAVSDFTKSIALDPTNADAYYQRGRAYLQLKYYVQAVDEFDKAVELSPKHPKAYYNRGYTKFLMQNFRGAVGDFNFAVEINPQSALAYFYRGESKHKLGDDEGACIDWTTAIELGYSYAGDFVQKYCEKLNLSSQKYIDKVIAKGDQKFNESDYQGALSEYNRALSMDPQYGEAYVSRGLVNLVLGDNEQACADWHKAIELKNSEAKYLYEQHCN